MNDEIRVVELFAGVGGFRVGLERAAETFKTIWANQWEPGRKVQHAFDCYVSHFGKTDNHVNKDIATVIDEVPQHDLLVGGFPCQDYSVARTGAQGIKGKKGVLWWSINEILEKRTPNYVLLENVDRLLKSPTNQRGRDFGIILRCLSNLGYTVEWRVINAADYGNAQRRRRTLIFAYKFGTPLHDTLASMYKTDTDLEDWIYTHGLFAKAFPVCKTSLRKSNGSIKERDYVDLEAVSNEFKMTFYDAGVMFNGAIVSRETKPISIPSQTLNDIVHQEPVNEAYFISDENMGKWEYLKGAKSIKRKDKVTGFEYEFKEGGIPFPEIMDRPSRTMLTSESSLNRSTHVVVDAQTQRLRLLTPVECERLNGFPDNWTSMIPEKARYFTMGNALVVNLIQRVGETLLQWTPPITLTGEFEDPVQLTLAIARKRTKNYKANN